MPYCFEVEHLWKNINADLHEKDPCRSKSKYAIFSKETSPKQNLDCFRLYLKGEILQFPNFYYSKPSTTVSKIFAS